MVSGPTIPAVQTTLKKILRKYCAVLFVMESKLTQSVDMLALKRMTYHEHYYYRQLKETVWELQLQVQEPIFLFPPPHTHLLSYYLSFVKEANSSQRVASLVPYCFPL